jgi:transcriptional regulator with XRE-family HTH domain
MTSFRPLGDYLRARRELLLPDDVGLPDGPGRRRVPGLRRAEVATLAGISTEYLVKLEQGTEIHPTSQVLDSLSRALRLDATATSYLHALARLPTRSAPPATSPAVEHSAWLIDSWPMTAAMVMDRHHDIKAVNPLMRALVDGYRPGRNALVCLLLDPAAQQLYLEWEGLSTRSIGLMRSWAGLEPEHPRATELIALLTAQSPRFREVWHRHDIVGMSEGMHPMNHPAVGELSLHYAHLPIAGSDGHTIFLYYAEPGSDSERALALLASPR